MVAARGGAAQEAMSGCRGAGAVPVGAHGTMGRMTRGGRVATVAPA